MSHQLKPETIEKIHEFTRNVSRSYHLDDKSCDKLNCRMKGRLAGYLNGDENLSEHDAFILLHEHFSDPVKLKGILSDFPITVASVSLERRLAAAVVAKIAAGMILFLIAIIADYMLVGWAMKFRPGASLFYRLMLFLKVFFSLFNLAFFLFILWMWRKWVEKGKRIWFTTLRASEIIFVLVGFYLIKSLIPYLILSVSFYPYMPPAFAHLDVINTIFRVKSFIIVVGKTLVWQWWCVPAGRLRSFLVATGALIAYYYTLAETEVPRYYWHRIPGLFPRIRSGLFSTVSHLLQPDHWSVPAEVLLGLAFGCALYFLWMVVRRRKTILLQLGAGHDDQ